jgi:hypothetical protein
MALRLSALSASRFLLPGSFLVLISVRGCVDPRVILLLEGLSILKISNKLIGNRTLDLAACNRVPQVTTLTRQACGSAEGIELGVMLSKIAKVFPRKSASVFDIIS